jgi:hypothetical protein
MKFIGVPGSIVTTLTCTALRRSLKLEAERWSLLGKPREVAVTTGTNPIGWSSAHKD